MTHRRMVRWVCPTCGPQQTAGTELRLLVRASTWRNTMQTICPSCHMLRQREDLTEQQWALVSEAGAKLVLVT